MCHRCFWSASDAAPARARVPQLLPRLVARFPFVHTLSLYVSCAPPCLRSMARWRHLRHLRLNVRHFAYGGEAGSVLGLLAACCGASLRSLQARPRRPPPHFLGPHFRRSAPAGLLWARVPRSANPQVGSGRMLRLDEFVSPGPLAGGAVPMFRRHLGRTRAFGHLRLLSRDK